MINKRSNIAFQFFVLISCSIAILSSCNKKSAYGMIIITETKGDLLDIKDKSDDTLRYNSDSRIVSLNLNKSKNEVKVLTEDFFSACSPEISFDGKFIVFAAQKRQQDVWQIWEMNLKNLKSRQVTFSTENCIDPIYLPNGQLLFSKLVVIDEEKTGHSLFTSDLDGSNVSQITYNPHTYFASKVLKDGRVLSISKQLYPDQRDGVLMIMRPDGSKNELFYRSTGGSVLHDLGSETIDGEIIFIESDINDNKNRSLISINYNQPMHSRINLSSQVKGDFYSINPAQKEHLLVSYRLSENERYAVYDFNIKNKTLGEAIYKNDEYNVIEATIFQNQERPKKLPSEINMSVKTGLLLCQDINFSGIDRADSISTLSKAVKIELEGIESSLGIVDVENDGSFYLKVLADTPFRIKTIDENGKVVNGPGSWLYLRPNERRGCVGCHDSNNQVPDNKQSLSTKKDPIIVPIGLEEVQNKKIH